MFLNNFEDTALTSSDLDVNVEFQKHFTRLFKQSVILLAGPTASGKTEVALQLAPIVNGEIVSVDSMQVYRNMDIGTAKVSQENRDKVVHHIIDIRHVQEPFSAVDFYYEAIQACQNILSRNKVPILVGGTGFYFKVFLEGPPEGPSPDLMIRYQLEQECDLLGIDALYQRLKEEDSHYASTITSRDRQKILRGLEIMKITGKKVSEIKSSSKDHQIVNYNCRGWFLSPQKDLLYQNVQLRCRDMMDQGLIDEIKYLLDIGITSNKSASKAIGYKQWIEFINQGESKDLFDKFFQDFCSASRSYVKRQYTWFKRYPIFRSLNLDKKSISTIASLIAEDYFLSLL